MIISTFSPAWFLMFFVQIAILVLIYLIAKKNPESRQTIMLVLYITLIVFYILYKGYLIWGSETYETCFWNELPLALCQVASLMAYPGIVKNNRIMLGMSFFVGTVCSLMGLLMPVRGFYDIPLLSPESIGFYGFHGLVFIQSICIFMLGFYFPQLKDIPGILLLLAGCAFVVHLINILLRSTVLPNSNYFFTFDPENNPVLQLLRGLIPINYVYLLPLLIPLGIAISVATMIIRAVNRDSDAEPEEAAAV